MIGKTDLASGRRVGYGQAGNACTHTHTQWPTKLAAQIFVPPGGHINHVQNVL